MHDSSSPSTGYGKSVPYEYTLQELSQEAAVTLDIFAIVEPFLKEVNVADPQWRGIEKVLDSLAGKEPLRL